MIGILQYVLCLIGIAVLSFVSYRFTMALCRRLPLKWADILMAAVPAISAAAASNAFAQHGGYPLIGRDGTLFVVMLGAALCAYLSFRGKYREIEPSVPTHRLLLLTALTLGLAGVMPLGMAAGQVDRWFLILAASMAAGLYFLPKNTAFASLQLRSYKAGQPNMPIVLIGVVVACSSGFIYLLAEHLATIAFEINASLGIADSIFAGIVFGLILLPYFKHIHNIGSQNSAEFAFEMLVSLTSRFLLAFLALHLPTLVWHENSALFGYSQTHIFMVVLLLACWNSISMRGDDKLPSFMVLALLIGSMNTWL